MNNFEKIWLETAQFGSSYGLTNKTKELSVEKIGKILRLAEDNGISFLDTSPKYGSA